jgi:hypothetical protein
MRKVFFLCFIFFTQELIAQDDMLKLLGKDSTISRVVNGTFKSTHLINLQSNETVFKKSLDFFISHRFGAMGKSSNATSTYHNLWGFDEVSDIRIAFEYGISDRLTTGFSRSKYKENWELLGKYRLLEQTIDNKTPFSITLFGNIALSTDQDLRYRIDTPSKSVEAQRRLSYVAQVIIAKKFSPRLSLALHPTFIHHNFVFPPNENNAYALGIGGRLKMTHTLSLVMDYVYNFGELRKIGNDNGYYNPLGAGIEIETGGHVFSIMFTNAYALIENEFITSTVDTWRKGGIRFSFNISRNFIFKSNH